MAVEIALYPTQFNTTLPASSDFVSEGDNHLRLIKTVVKTTFPNLGGAWNATQTEANYLVGVTSGIQTQINTKGAIAGQTWTGTHVFPSTTTIGGLTPTIRGYLETVTSDAQAQLNARALKAGDTYSGTHNFTGATVRVPTLAPGATGDGAASVDFANALAFASALPGQSGNAGKVVTTNGASASWTDAITLSSLNGGQLAGMRNKIINGDMRIDQRYNGAAVTYPGPVSAGSEMYCLDRWLGNSTGSPRFSMQRSTEAPPGFTNSLLITTTMAGTPASGDFCYFAQAIEGHNVADLAFGRASAKPVAIGFWVRSSLTGAFGGSIANDSSSRRNSFSFQVNSANTWEYKTISLPGDTSGAWVTDTGIGLKFVIDLGSGASNKGTAGSWGALAASGMAPTGSVNLVATNGATMHVTGVQLEVGPVATPFEHRPYGMELALCQRYYYRVKASAVGDNFGIGYNSATTGANYMVWFPTVMRTAPAALGQSGTATDYSVLHGSGTITTASAVPTFAAATDSAARVVFTVASGLTAGDGSAASASTTNAYLGFSAEL